MLACDLVHTVNYNVRHCSVTGDCYFIQYKVDYNSADFRLEDSVTVIETASPVTHLQWREELDYVYVATQIRVSYTFLV